MILPPSLAWAVSSLAQAASMRQYYPAVAQTGWVNFKCKTRVSFKCSLTRGGIEAIENWKTVKKHFA